MTKKTISIEIQFIHNNDYCYLSKTVSINNKNKENDKSRHNF